MSERDFLLGNSAEDYDLELSGKAQDNNVRSPKKVGIEKNLCLVSINQSETFVLK